MILESPSEHGIVAKTKETNGISNGVASHHAGEVTNGAGEHANGGNHTLPDVSSDIPNDLTTNETSPAQWKKAPSLLLFSAFSRGAVESHFNACRDAWKSQGGKVASLSDLGYTLASRREQKPYRAFAVTDDVFRVDMSITQLAPEVAPHVIWVFTGQGAQWPRMGVDLLDQNDRFRATIHRLDESLLTLPDPPQWTIEGISWLLISIYRIQYCWD